MPINILGITIGGHEVAFMQLGAGLAIAVFFSMMAIEELSKWIKRRLDP